MMRRFFAVTRRIPLKFYSIWQVDNETILATREINLRFLQKFFDFLAQQVADCQFRNPIGF